MKHLIKSPLGIGNFNQPSSFSAFSSLKNMPLTSFTPNKQSLLKRDISLNDQTKSDINEINKIFETSQKNESSNVIKQDQIELIKNKLRSLEPKKLSQLIASATLSGNDFAEHLKIMNQLRDDIIAIGSNVTEKKDQFGILQPIIFNPQTTPSLNFSEIISLDDLTNIVDSFCQSSNQVELCNFFNKTLFQSNKDVQLIFSNSSITEGNLEDFKNSIAELELKLTEQLKNKSPILSDIEKSAIIQEILQLKQISKALSEKKDVHNQSTPEYYTPQYYFSYKFYKDPAYLASLPAILALCFEFKKSINKYCQNRRNRDNEQGNNQQAVIEATANEQQDHQGAPIEDAAILAVEDAIPDAADRQEANSRRFFEASPQQVTILRVVSEMMTIQDWMRRYILGVANLENSRMPTRPQENDQERQPQPRLGSSRSSARLEGNLNQERQPSRQGIDNSR